MPRKEGGLLGEYIEGHRFQNPPNEEAAPLLQQQRVRRRPCGGLQLRGGLRPPNLTQLLCLNACFIAYACVVYVLHLVDCYLFSESHTVWRPMTSKKVAATLRLPSPTKHPPASQRTRVPYRSQRPPTSTFQSPTYFMCFCLFIFLQSPTYSTGAASWGRAA